MSIHDFDPEILQDFLTESGELLEQLEGDLVELEAAPADPEMLNKVFRALHTIKGSASFLALTNLVEIAHAAESALNAARNGEVHVGRTEMDLLLEAVDVIRVQMGELTDGSHELTAAEPNLVAQLVAIGDGNQAGGGETPTATATADPVESTEPPASTTPGVRPITLEGAKADLLDPFVADLEESLSQVDAQLARLRDESERAGAATLLAELGEDLAKTTDFFEIDEMSGLASALRRATESLGELDAETDAQIIPRLEALASLLAEQADGLKRGELVIRHTDSLIAHIDAVLAGEEIPDDAALPPGASRDDVMLRDRVNGESAPAETPSEPESVDPAPAANAPVAPVAPQPTTAAKPTAPAPQQAPARQAGPKQNSAAGEQTIRVEVGRLETLMNLVGELVLQKNRISALASDVIRSGVDTELAEQMELSSGTLDRVTGDIQVAVMKTRMQPLDKLFGKYPRLIRDLAKKTNKNLRLVIEGGETEVDKSVIEELGDPLVHLLRNSADHGIEPPAERREAGKPEEGIITLRACHDGGHVRVEIIDDGRGLAREKIGGKAVERGLITPEQLNSLSDEEVFRFIFQAGFSTADQVSDLSGRGVGMDVVRTNIEKLKGEIGVSSRTGEGTTLTVTIPLTVAIMPAMMVAVADESYAVPLGNILEIVRPTDEQLCTVGEAPVVRLRGAVLPLVSGQQVFDVPADRRTDEPFVVVLAVGERQVGLRVTRVIGQQEIVIKALDGIERTGPVSGATVRNDGGVSLIVDVTELLRRSRSIR